MFDPRVHRFTNNASGRLAASISNISTFLVLESGQGGAFPAIASGEIFKLTIDDVANGVQEICHCTARAGDVFTVERGQEGTAAVPFDAGTFVQHRVTAGTLEWLQSLITP